MVISSLLGVPPTKTRRRAARHRPPVPHRARASAWSTTCRSPRASSSASTSAGQLERARRPPARRHADRLVAGRDHRRRRRHAAAHESESTTFAVLLVSAGTETVARLLGWAGVVLAAHPDQRADLAADPALIPNAIEELLRYEAPSPVQGRGHDRRSSCTARSIPPDSKVLLLTGSAGRDEREYADPDRFDIHRELRHHVSFGYGIHFCVGAALAASRAAIALEETLKRFPRGRSTTIERCDSTRARCGAMPRCRSCCRHTRHDARTSFRLAR